MNNAYIASGWFNPDQAEDLGLIKGCLKAYGINFFSPKDECLCPPDAPEEDKIHTFRLNLRAIENADFIVCNTRNKDMGSIFEAGYAYKCKKPIIYFCRGLQGQFNLMLAKSGIAVATDSHKLAYYVGQLKMNAKFSEPYTEDIQ